MTKPVGLVVLSGWLCRWPIAAGKRPVPFRTRKLSLRRADGTALGRVWESRLLPTLYNFMFLRVDPDRVSGLFGSTLFFVFLGGVRGYRVPGWLVSACSVITSLQHIFMFPRLQTERSYLLYREIPTFKYHLR